MTNECNNRPCLRRASSSPNGKKVGFLMLIFLLYSFSTFAQSLSTPFPYTFRNTRSNELANPVALHTFFQRIRDGKAVKVMQIGDSHTRGNVYPRTVEKTLKAYFPQLDFAYYGINGAWAHRFYEQDMIQRVANEHPQLVIISFGTNEAHGNFDAHTHNQTLDMLTQRIAARCPEVVFLLTTPPGSYISVRTGQRYTIRRSRRRRTRYATTKVRNERTERVARNLLDYGNAHQMVVWDLFTIAGGPTHACSNWRDAGLMRADGVHFLAAGYQLQGTLLAEAIIKAYEQVAPRSSQTRMFQPPTPQEQRPNASLKGF